MPAFMPDGDYSVEIYHTFVKNFEFFGLQVHREMIQDDPYMALPGTVNGDKLTIGNLTVDIMNNPYFQMEFILRARLKGTRDVVIFRKIGSANLPGFGAGGQ